VTYNSDNVSYHCYIGDISYELLQIMQIIDRLITDMGLIYRGLFLRSWYSNSYV